MREAFKNLEEIKSDLGIFYPHSFHTDFPPAAVGWALFWIWTGAFSVFLFSGANEWEPGNSVGRAFVGVTIFCLGFYFLNNHMFERKISTAWKRKREDDERFGKLIDP